jgi:hypothetical protein
LLPYFKSKVGWKDVFKQTIWNESLDELNNDNGVRVENFATSQSKVQCSNIATFRNMFGRVQIGKLSISLTIF